MEKEENIIGIIYLNGSLIFEGEYLNGEKISK